MRDRFEIVDDRKLAQAERIAQFGNRHRPRKIHVDDRVVDHVAGERQRDAIGVAVCDRRAELVDDRSEARILRAGVLAILQDREIVAAGRPGTQQCEARMRAADVRGDQRHAAHASNLVLAGRSAHCSALPA
jgi:hypothetical protein